MSDREERAARRRQAASSWLIRQYLLEEEPEYDVRDLRNMAERFAAVWPISLEAWQFSGRPMPTYTRQNIPFRVSSLDEQDGE